MKYKTQFDEVQSSLNPLSVTRENWITRLILGRTASLSQEAHNDWFLCFFVGLFYVFLLFDTSLDALDSKVDGRTNEQWADSPF